MITKIYSNMAKKVGFKAFSYLLPLTSYLFITACSDEVNNWPVDPSYDRLYQTTHFEVDEVMPTSVILKFNGITSATKYVFEFSIDRAEKFDNIVRTDEVKADTLAPFSEGKVITQNEYKKTFEDLGGTTNYSVRVKGIDELTGTESGWNAITFTTPAEQIFTGATPGITDVVMAWQADKVATGIRMSSIIGKDTTEVSSIELTAAQKASGEALFEGLKPGTTYLAQIMNGEFVRGTWTFSTLGSSKGAAIEVHPGDDVNVLLAEAGADVVTLIFKGGLTYEVGTLTIPETVRELYVSGSLVGGVRAELLIPSVSTAAAMESLNFQYVDVNAQAGFWMMLGGDRIIKNFYITGSVFRNINNCILYCDAEGEIENICIDNSILDHVSTGGWGMFNIPRNTTARNLIVTNTTITDVADQFVDIRIPFDLMKFDHCTFCNFNVGMPKLLRVEAQPREMVMTNMIFAGDNAGQKMNSGWGDYSGWLDFSGCYMTSDFTEDSRKFVNVTHLDYTTDELFVDPRHGDFHVKDDVQFRGKGKAGDPRWW